MFLLPLGVVKIVGARVLGGGLVFVGCACGEVQVGLKLFDCVSNHLELCVVQPELFRWFWVVGVGVDIVAAAVFLVVLVFPLVDGHLFHVKMGEGVGDLEGVADL